jgi:hypothetical protein
MVSFKSLDPNDIFRSVAQELTASVDKACVECCNFVIEKRQEPDYSMDAEIFGLRAKCKAYEKKSGAKFKDICPDLVSDDRIRGKSLNWMIVDELGDHTWSDRHNQPDHFADIVAYGLQTKRPAEKSRDTPKTDSIEAW